MQLAKPQIDTGLSSNHLAPLLEFWQSDVGVEFDHVLPIHRGQDQHRHDIAGSVLKINHHTTPLPATPHSGYRELIIARSGLSEPVPLTDPDGNRVMLVPHGYNGVTQIGVRVAVRQLDAHRRFYGNALGPRGGMRHLPRRREPDHPRATPIHRRSPEMRGRMVDAERAGQQPRTWRLAVFASTTALTSVISESTKRGSTPSAASTSAIALGNRATAPLAGASAGWGSSPTSTRASAISTSSSRQMMA